MDVLDLLMPIFSGSKDEYCRDVVPPLPLSVDRVMENRPFKSTAALLRLAPEVLAIILSYVEPESLGSLALVNSDCRQLARSRQFASVCFDYGDAALMLIDLLLKEKALRNRSNNVWGGVGGTIGPCIRRLRVATHPEWVKYRHDIELSEEFNALEKGVREERLARASDTFSIYMKSIELILSSRATLPHLELLDWEDRVPLQQTFFNGLTTSGIQHLKLNGVSLSQEFEIIQPPVSQKWNLRTLNMKILWSIMRLGEGVAAPLCTSLLQSCSHSLETLVWKELVKEKFTFGSDPAKFPRFEKLRNLKLGFIRFGDRYTVDALLKPSLSVLDLKYCRDRLIGEALQRRGRIASLETLVFSLQKRSIDNYLEFLKANTQISKLTVKGETVHNEEEESYGGVPEEMILPILSSSFNALKSLRLSWNSRVTIIPEVALQIISGLQGLEQVCLSAGFQLGWKHDWLIDHESIRNNLSNLPRLKKIAFIRDSYNHPAYVRENSHLTYYSERFPNQEEMDAAGLDWGSEEAMTQAWEYGHKRRMVLEAEKYIASMAKLEWIFLGQYPMAVMKGTSEEDERHAVPLCDERDSCDTLLDRMFGWHGLGSD